MGAGGYLDILRMDGYRVEVDIDIGCLKYY